MQPVATLVDRELSPELTAVERRIFGTADPETIAVLLEGFCSTHLGAPAAGGHFYRSSVGCVVGLALASGEDVVVKAYQPRWHARFLTAVQRVQRAAADGGLPCPRPLAPPAPLGPGLATLAAAESWLPDPGLRPIASVAARQVSAAGLARQIALCNDLGPEGPAVLAALGDHPLRTPDGALYGVPHSPLFDFSAAARGAEWIDAFARRGAAGREPDAMPKIIGHTDWSTRNIRIDDERLLAVYDWDSAAAVAESTAVGQAAITWCVTSEPGGPPFPSAVEAAAYVRDYEDAVGRPLTQAQWRATGAAATYTLAYVARCEHAVDAIGIERAAPRAARDRLADDGEALLALTRP